MNIISIPKPQRDVNGKIKGEFYPLQRAELLALRETDLARGPFYVHLCLRFENPWCDRPFKISPTEFCKRWQVSESKFYRSIAELKKRLILYWESSDVFFCWTTPHSGSELPIVGVTPHSGSETPHSGSETPHSGSETPHSGSETPHSGSETPHSGNFEASEPLLGKPFKDESSQTIQTIQNLKTFSDKGEGEKTFFNSESKNNLSSSTSLIDKPEIKQPTYLITHQDHFSAVAGDPFFNRRSKPQEIAWDWLPQGPWKIEEGKLDPNFQTALAQRWLKEHGGDLHEKRAKVLKHFRNEPTNLPIEWEWYQSTFIHKVANIQVRKENGFNTSAEEEEVALQARAMMPLSEEMSVTPVKTPTQIIEQNANYAIPTINNLSKPSLPSDEAGGFESVAAYSLHIKSDELNRDYWESTKELVRKEKLAASTPEEIKAAMEALRIKVEERSKNRSSKLTSIQQIILPQDNFLSVLEDMRKYLVSGNDDLRQVAIDWASKEVADRCQLLRNSSGKIIDIRQTVEVGDGNE